MVIFVRNFNFLKTEIVTFFIRRDNFSKFKNPSAKLI